MGIQKIAFNFAVERGGKLAKSFLCTKPTKVTNIRGLKYTPEILTDDIKIEKNFSDFARENKDFLTNELARIFGNKSFKNYACNSESSSYIQQLLYNIDSAYDLTIINNLKYAGYTQKEICDLMKLPNKRILQCAFNYQYCSKPAGTEKLCQMSAKELKDIVMQYPNLEEKYFGRLFEIKVKIGKNKERRLSLDEIKEILKNSKIQDKFLHVMKSKKTNLCQVPRATTQPSPPSGSIPRYIYHITNPENYLKILKSGQLHTSVDGFIGEGIFFTDLENLFKHWGRDYAWGEKSLRADLIKQCRKENDGLVMLKIPTSSLDYKKLSVRSQQRLASHLEGEEREFIDFVNKDLANVRCEEKDIPKAVLCSINRYLDKLSRQDNHIYTGSPASNSKLFKQRKEAIEYIYSEPIGVDKITKVGDVNIKELCSVPEYDPTHPIRSIFGALLSGTPEAKGIKLIKE